MSGIQNRDRLHTQDDSPAKIEGYETPGENAAEDYAAVRVHVTNDVATTTGATQFGAYVTFVIPPSAAGAPSVLQILPHDPLRQYAYVQAIDAPIVIATTQEECYSLVNIGAANPAGGYASGGWTPPIRHNEAIYACNTSLSVSCRVVVMVERGST